jgi:hypothetical protein
MKYIFCACLIYQIATKGDEAAMDTGSPDQHLTKYM